MERSESPDCAVVTVLGGFDVSVGGRRISLAPREMRLVALLALHGQSPRDFLSGTLWPDTTQDRAATSLRAAAYKIRRTAPALIEVNRCAIGLVPGVQTDLEALRECLDSVTGPAEFSDPRHALGVLSSGPLLAGWRDDWILHERERLRHRRLRALGVLAEQCLAAVDPYTALAAARAAESIEPLSEHTHVLAVRALKMMGCHDQAVAHHGRFVTRLRRELGISPSEQFVRLLATG